MSLTHGQLTNKILADQAKVKSKQRAIQREWESYQDNYDDFRDYDDDGFGDYEGRQHGGPVRSGRPYVVGEGGPEMFVPSSSGRIVPNGGSGGGMDSKGLARAVADALEGTRIDVDGRRLGRLTVRHQPLAVAELGGRR